MTFNAASRLRSLGDRSAALGSSRCELPGMHSLPKSAVLPYASGVGGLSRRLLSIINEAQQCPACLTSPSMNWRRPHPPAIFVQHQVLGGRMEGSARKSQVRGSKDMEGSDHALAALASRQSEFRSPPSPEPQLAHMPWPWPSRCSCLGRIRNCWQCIGHNQNNFPTLTEGWRQSALASLICPSHTIYHKLLRWAGEPRLRAGLQNHERNIPETKTLPDILHLGVLWTTRERCSFGFCLISTTI